MLHETQPKPKDRAPALLPAAPTNDIAVGSTWRGTYRVLINDFNATMTVASRDGDRIRLAIKYSGRSGDGSIVLEGTVKGTKLELKPAAGYSHVESFNLQYDPKRNTLSGKDAVRGGTSERSLNVTLQKKSSR